MHPEKELEREQIEIINQKMSTLWNVPPFFFDNSCWNGLSEADYIDNLENGLRNSIKIDKCQTLIRILLENEEFLDRTRTNFKIVQYIVDRNPLFNNISIADQITDYRTITLIYMDWFKFVKQLNREDITRGVLDWLWINYKETFLEK